jgi:hypothetical protein
VQELGVSGRMLGVLPGTTGGIDLYEVAGGYATTDNNGIALGLLGGMLPAGQPRDRCGPPATAPAPVTIPQSAFFQGNQRPDTSAPFDVAIGVHQNQLDRFAYSAYDGGLLCLTIGSSTIDLINTGSIGLFIPSLSKLANTAAPMAIGLRPQAPPTIVLGPNTFIDDGMGNLTVDQPLLDLTFIAMEIDFFAMVEGQYIRIFTLVADVHLPVGLDVGAAGDIIPVLGDLEGAFSNITVKNSEALQETPEELADIFPTILQLALGQLGGLGSFDVPELGGLQVSVTEITAVDSNTFLAIFGELMPAMAAPAPRVDTTAMIARVDVPPTATFADARSWRGARRPTVELALRGSGLEWQTRVDGISWSAWSPHAERTLAADTFWVQGRHTIEVRARRAGEPWTADLTPVVMHTMIDTIAPVAELEAAPTFVRVRGTDNVAGERLAMRYRFDDGAWTESPIGLPIALAGRDLASLEVEVRDAAGNAVVATGAAAKPAPFHGQPGESGCSCGASSPGAGGGLLVVLTALLLMRPRRRLGRALAFVMLCGLMPACDCGSDPPCGDVACLEGDVAHGPVGKYNSVASDGDRTVVSTYDQRLGDLVVVDVIPGSEPVHVAVDGIPDETPTHEPSSYRGGIEGAGVDVGWWTSIALHDGAARVAYQDVTYGDLRFARENDAKWTTYTIDDDPATAGAYASLALSSSGTAAIAYMATGVDDGTDVRAAELRLARADTENPDADEWTVTTLASAPSSCGGLCGAGTECVKPVNAGEPEVCAAPTSDCAAPCADTEACVAGTCRAVVGEPLADHPQGTGLFANAMFLADGRIAIVHYDRARTALVLLVESAAGSSSFTETILDDAGDRGFWASAVTDGNTIHVAYQDALGDQLLYVAWNGTVQPVEVVDDGVREGDRTHPVGAGAAIYLDGATPAIAYQDGLVADLVLARRDGGTWTHEAIATGALLDGFHIAAASNGPWIVWDSADIAKSPVTTLTIREP